MKYLLLVSTFLIYGNLLFAKNSKDYLVLGDNAVSNMQEKAALIYYKKALKLNPQEIEALNGASVMCSNIGNRSSLQANKKAYYNAAITFAKTALKVNAQNANANFAMALAYGRKVYLINAPKPRIAMSALIKKYAERAVRIDPKHNEALTMLGIWHYERATLTFAEKKIVALLGGLPNGSIIQAKEYLEKSKSIAPGNIATLVELGKVYKELGKKNKVLTLWKQALNKANQYKDDAARKTDLKKRLTSIQ